MVRPPWWCDRLPAAAAVCAVQIPLLQTLPGTSAGGRQLRWYSLLRRTGSQHITGDLQVGVAAPPVLLQAACCMVLLFWVLSLAFT